MTTWHLVTGEYPPFAGGVGDYTRTLASELARRGHSVHVWCPSLPKRAEDGPIHLHGLPDAFGARSRRMLQSAWDDCPAVVLLQYVPNALGAAGLNLPFCRWLERTGSRTDLRVMFHEPYFYFSWDPAGNVRAVVQRLMARALVNAGRIIYLSTEVWRRYLPRAERMIVLPVASAIPRSRKAEAVARFRAPIVRGESRELVGHFGTYGRDVANEVEPVIVRVLQARPSAHFICIGRRSDRFAAGLRDRYVQLADRVHHTGVLEPEEVASAIRACDVMVQPYPDGITTRRTSVMAALTNGVATVSTEGELTEALWRETPAAALAPASNPRATAAAVLALLDDPARRRQLADAGRRAYDSHFAIENSLRLLLKP